MQVSTRCNAADLSCAESVHLLVEGLKVASPSLGQLVVGVLSSTE